jgi:RNA polymerase sigma-70 factor (ECF subfamily)
MAFTIDRPFLERVQSGETVALNTLVAQVSPHIERQLLRYPVSEEDRRDLLQATLMQIVRRIGSFRGDSSFSTWLFRVTANEALMMMRSQRRHKAKLVVGLELEDLSALPAANDSHANRGDALAIANQRDAEVRKALAELPEEYRAVVVAHYERDLGLQEIADELSLTESAVRSRLHRARSRLRGLLEATPIAADAMEEARIAAPPSARQTRRGAEQHAA